MRALDVLLAVPVIVFVLLFISMLGSSAVFIMVLVGVAWIPTVARTIRAATLEISQREFIEAAEVVGTRRWRILVHDVLPNLMTLILVELGLRCAWSIAEVSAISFLGIWDRSADAGLGPDGQRKRDWGKRPAVVSRRAGRVYRSLHDRSESVSGRAQSGGLRH